MSYPVMKRHAGILNTYYCIKKLICKATYWMISTTRNAGKGKNYSNSDWQGCKEGKLMSCQNPENFQASENAPYDLQG